MVRTVESFPQILTTKTSSTQRATRRRLAVRRCSVARRVEACAGAGAPAAPRAAATRGNPSPSFVGKVYISRDNAERYQRRTVADRGQFTGRSSPRGGRVSRGSRARGQRRLALSCGSASRAARMDVRGARLVIGSLRARIVLHRSSRPRSIDGSMTTRSDTHIVSMRGSCSIRARPRFSHRGRTCS